MAVLQQTEWIAVHADGFTVSGARARCHALAPLLVERGWSCLIAAGTRFMAPQFGHDCQRVFEQYGVPTSSIASPVPFPAIELALLQGRADCALVVGARNRPYWYGGLILLGPSHEPLLIDPPPFVDTTPFPTAPPAPDRLTIDIRSPYIEALRDRIDVDLIKRSALTIFVDAMSGTGAGIIPAVLGDDGQAKAVEINREPDAFFGKQTPNPAEHSLARLRKLVRESGSTFGSAISADGRALAVVDQLGETIAPLDLALLLGHYLARQHRQRGVIVAPAGSPEPPGGLRAWMDASGIGVELAADPTARAAALRDGDRSGALIAVSADGEVSVGHDGGTPDATRTTLLLAELCARNGGTLRGSIEATRANGK